MITRKKTLVKITALAGVLSALCLIAYYAAEGCRSRRKADQEETT